MNRQYTLKSIKSSKLPSLHKDSKKSIFKPNQSLLNFLSQQKKINFGLSEYPGNLEQVKANNFINKNPVISSPSVISNLSQCIKKQYSKKLEVENQFSELSIIKNSLKNSPSQSKIKTNIHKQNIFDNELHGVSTLNNSSIFQDNKKYSFQRKQLLNLAKWIDQKLQSFNKKDKIQVNQIIDYKQHILNYGLGKVIDSVGKKCKQQGQLLRILIQNSFKIFQKVLQIVSNSVIIKQKQHIQQQNQTKQIFNTNLSFLRQENDKISSQLENVYQKMKKVIIWNKRLRKQKKNLNIMNRVLQYRNQTYSQALQQTIDMFLKSVPQPATLNFSKKIISKLARQKRRKKKGFQRMEADQDFKIQAKQYVLSWLRRNGFKEEEDQEIDPTKYLNNDQKIELTKIDDQNKTNQVDIFDYFKLLDIGVQATQQMKDISCQYDDDLKTKTTSKAIVTDTIFKKNFQIQTNMNDGVWFKEQIVKKSNPLDKQSKVLRKNQKKKSNVSRFSEKSQKFKERSQNRKTTKQPSQITENQTSQQKNQKFSKNSARSKNKQLNKNYRRKEDQRQNSSIKYVNQNTIQSLQEDRDNRFYEKDFTIISQKKSQQFNFDSEQQIKNSPSEKYRVSISKLNGIQSKFNKYDASKLQNGQFKMGRQISIKQFTQIAGYDQAQIQALGQNNLKKLWKFIQNSKASESGKRDSRLSMNFIKYDNSSYSMKKLQKKFFNQVYEEGKINSMSKQKQRQNLFQTVVRRRSFYKKGKVMFENAVDVEESKQTKSNLYRSYLHYRTHRNKTIVELSEQQEQRLDQINKKIPIPSNLAKSKALAASKETFKQISQSCKKTKKQPPKNKQYFNSSLVSITKNVGALIYDYIKQIKRQKDEIQNDCQKIYYPLHTILVDKMNWKYGLKDISEKKIKDFIQKILTFAPVSQKISLYSLLFGMETEGVGTDQLLVYLKCLVYLQKKQSLSSSIHLVKETNLADRVNTDLQIVEENIEKILKQFFDKQGIQSTKAAIYQYLQQNPKHISIQKIAEITIRCLLKQKQLYKKDCLQLYRLLIKGNNIFSNLYKILKIFNKYGNVSFNKFKTNNLQHNNNKSGEIDISSTLKQFIRRSDTIDQIYGKSISFDRFLTAYMVTRIPKFEYFNQSFTTIISIFNQKFKETILLKNIQDFTFKDNIKVYCNQNVKILQQIQKKWQIKNGQKIEEENWQWNVTKTITEHVQNNMKGLLGKLGTIGNQIQNFFFSMEKRKENLIE